jgi:hypothetical protein
MKKKQIKINIVIQIGHSVQKNSLVKQNFNIEIYTEAECERRERKTVAYFLF